MRDMDSLTLCWTDLTQSHCPSFHWYNQYTNHRSLGITILSRDRSFFVQKKQEENARKWCILVHICLEMNYIIYIMEYKHTHFGDQMKTTSQTLSPNGHVIFSHNGANHYGSFGTPVCNGSTRKKREYMTVGRRRIECVLVSEPDGTIREFKGWVDSSKFYGCSKALIRELEYRTLQDHPPLENHRFYGYECVVLTK